MAHITDQRFLEKVFEFLEQKGVKKGLLTKEKVKKWKKKGYHTSYTTIEEVLIKAYVAAIDDPAWDGSL